MGINGKLTIFQGRTITNILCLLVIILLSAVSAGCGPESDFPETGEEALDHIIDIVMSGEMNELREIIRFTQTDCTNAYGLGGPPKCLEGESEGDEVAVLPFLGPEGHFLRENEYGLWNGLEVSELYAVYRVSENAYSDENYPAGEFAIVFLDQDGITSIVLQVRDGSIVRIDNLFGDPLQINEKNVAEYLIAPSGLTP